MGFIAPQQGIPFARTKYLEKQPGWGYSTSSDLGALAKKIADQIQDSPNYDWAQFVYRWGNCVRASGGVPDTAQMQNLTECLAAAAAAATAGMPLPAIVVCLMKFSQMVSATYYCMYEAF
jgi:hypothetical protein